MAPKRPLDRTQGCEIELSVGYQPADESGVSQGDTCPYCARVWHGLTGNGLTGAFGCPGAYATRKQLAEWGFRNCAVRQRIPKGDTP